MPQCAQPIWEAVWPSRRAGLYVLRVPQRGGVQQPVSSRRAEFEREAAGLIPRRRHRACDPEQHWRRGPAKLRITVVTICFNQAEYLRECIDSVLGQDHDDVEYIIVDPGSTDGSRSIIEDYEGRVTPIFEPDAGPAAVRRPSSQSRRRRRLREQDPCSTRLPGRRQVRRLA